MLPFGRIVVAFVAVLAARCRTAIGSLPHHRKSPGRSLSGLLSWDSLAAPPSSVEPCVHSRRLLRGPSVSSDQPEIPFRPRGFTPPRRLAPHGACGRVASHSRPWGPPRFVTAAPCVTAWTPAFAPRDANHTLRRIPLPCSRSTSPWSLPPCRCPRHFAGPLFKGRRTGRCSRSVRARAHTGVCDSARHPTLPDSAVSSAVASSGTSRGVGFEAFLRWRVCNVYPPFPAGRRPILPWALFPFRGLSSTARRPP